VGRKKTVPRIGFRSQEYWSYAEAAEFTGFAQSTLRSYHTRPVGGRHRWVQRFHTRFPIEAGSFKQWFEGDGVPYGETVEERRDRMARIREARTGVGTGAGDPNWEHSM